MTKKSVVASLIDNLEQQGLGGTAAKVWDKLSGKRFGVPAKLSMLVVEVTTYCNLECSGCVRTIMTNEGDWANKHMAVADFRKLIDAAPPAALFIPQGIGESTMHPDIVELITIAKKSGKFDRVEINSNALVRPVEFYGRLFEAGLDDLSISVDTLDGGLIESLRAKTDIPKLEARLKEFSDRYPGKIAVRVTVSKGNLRALPALLGRLNGLGRFKVALQPFFDMGVGAGVLDAAEAATLDADAVGWNRDFTNLTVVPEPFVPSKEVCPSPWKSPAVTVDGELKPCCMILHQEKVNFGNVFKVPFKDLWSGEDVEKFRKSFVERSPACCAKCPYYAARA